MSVKRRVQNITKKIGLKSSGIYNIHSRQKHSPGRQMVAAAVKHHRNRTGLSGASLKKMF